MTTLEDTVHSVVQGFINNATLFTALDVSNAVKQALPNARHREVRDVVRNMFCSDIESQGWARKAITVNLEDGQQAEALLYHPASDAWDLDTKYDDQKRAQTSLRPVVAAQAVLAQAVASIPVGSTIGTAPTPAPAPVAPTPMPNARTQWDDMFKTQPSLFPVKS